MMRLGGKERSIDKADALNHSRNLTHIFYFKSNCYNAKDEKSIEIAMIDAIWGLT